MNAKTNNLYYSMKTTNFIRIAFRILMQSLIPMLLMELIVVFLFGMIDTTPTYKTYIGHATTTYTLIGTLILGGSIALFGIWFHFMSEYRFKNRKPRGLYREYLMWLMEE